MSPVVVAWCALACAFVCLVAAGIALGISRSCINVASQCLAGQFRMNKALTSLASRMDRATSLPEVQFEWQRFTQDLAEYEASSVKDHAPES